MKMAILGIPTSPIRRPQWRMAPVAFALAFLALPASATAQTTGGGAWTLPDPTDLVARAIRRIVSQDKPGGLPVSDFPHRAFGRDETAAAVRAYLGRTASLPVEAFGSVQGWPSARAGDSLPCAPLAVPTPVVPAVALAGTEVPVDRCANPNALWLAITRIERGPLPHELHIWYATHFRTDTQGIVQESTYSFCERWLRVGGSWKYDGFVRVSRGVVAP